MCFKFFVIILVLATLFCVMSLDQWMQKSKEKEGVNSEETVAVEASTKRKKYDCLFREEWTKTFPWLRKENYSRQGKRCILCNTNISGGYWHLKRHEENSTHLNFLEEAQNTPKIANFVAKENGCSIKAASKQLELALSLFIAEHNLPLKALDHLNLCLKNNIGDSKIVQNMTINRKKSQNILKYLVAPENIDNIKLFAKENYYSIIIDESTDIATSKNLGCIIRIFDKKCYDRFLGLIPVEDCSSEGLYNALISFLNQNDIPLKNMISFTADNCSTMMGVKNGVQAKLKQVVPNLFVHGCVCHNLNLMSQRAFITLPDKIDKLMREINHHFCHSPSRKSKFKEFQAYYGSELHAILRFSATRWLSRQAVIDRIIEQWTPLSYYFGLTDFEAGYGNENIGFISNSLKDPIIKMYFLFLSYVLKMINNINVEMQSEDPRMHIFISRMQYLFNQISRNFMSKKYLDSVSIKNTTFNENTLQLNNVYCGTQCEIFKNAENLSDSDIQEFKRNVCKFYKTFCEALLEKIDFENLVLNFIPKFSPEHVLSGETNSILTLLLNLFPEKEIDKAEIINQEYRSLSDFPQVKIFRNLSISEFWTEVSLLKNELGETLFPNIYRIVTGVLWISHSSANIERVFSIQNLIKTKCRNRLAVPTVSALIHSKDLLKSSSTFCYNCNYKRMISRNIPTNAMEENSYIE